MRVGKFLEKKERQLLSHLLLSFRHPSDESCHLITSDHVDSYCQASEPVFTVAEAVRYHAVKYSIYNQCPDEEYCYVSCHFHQYSANPHHNLFHHIDHSLSNIIVGSSPSIILVENNATLSFKPPLEPLQKLIAGPTRR